MQIVVSPLMCVYESACTLSANEFKNDLNVLIVFILHKKKWNRAAEILIGCVYF